MADAAPYGAGMVCSFDGYNFALFGGGGGANRPPVGAHYNNIYGEGGGDMYPPPFGLH